MRESGKVVRDDFAGTSVRITAKGGCASCQAKSVCNMDEKKGFVEMEVENTRGAGVGDLVEVELGPGKTVFSAFLVFGMPLVGALVGFAAGSWFNGGQEGGALGSIAGVALMFGLLWILQRFVFPRVWFRPRIVRILRKSRD